MLDLSSSGARGRAGHRRRRGAWLSVIAAAVVLALGVPTASTAAVRAGGTQRAGSAAQAAAAQTAAYQTTEQYVIRYWGRWVTYTQQSTIARIHGTNTLLGPATINPRFQAVNLINDDTIYAFGYVDVRNGPAVLTIPATNVTFSILVLDMFQEVVPVSIPASPGKYLLVSPGWRGTVPAGLTKVTVPYPVTLWNIRADKYSSNVNMIAQAMAFRAALHMTTLADYEADPASGPAKVLPVVPTFAVSLKVAEDTAATLAPNVFLRTLQAAVADPSTTPLYPSDLQLAHAFNQDFAAAQQAARRGNPVPLARIDAAVRAAYAAIVVRWRSHTGATNWIHFNNIADWGTAYLDRAAANEFCMGCNNEAAAGYWMAFADGAGQRLNGARHSYTLTFPAGDIPQAKRFWSVTAYTPGFIELVPNRADKYLVASYTPGLVTNPDGSITIYLSPTRPAGVPMANWLPVPRYPFEIALRAYGPTGNTANPGYAPPAITPAP
jgi:hypothetical protein